MKNKTLWIIAVLVCLVSVLVYLPALHNDFVNWDDIDYVYENPHLKTPAVDFVMWAFTTSRTGYWHPLTWLSLRADYALWGLNPAGYHLTSFLMHGLNALLVVLLAGSLFMKGLHSEKGPVLFGASVVGVLFALHPFHVESVAWISERKDVLYAFFWLLSLLAYAKYTASAAGRRKVVFYLLCFMSFALSVLSKPMAVTLPVVLLILDFYPFRRLEQENSFIKVVLLEKLPFVLLSGAVSFWTIITQKEQGVMNVMEHLSLGKRTVGAIKALGFYSAKTVWPAGLVPFYPLDPAISLFTWQNILSLFFVLAVTIVSAKLWRRMPLLIAAWSYYIITLLPVLGIIQVGSQAAADRYMYLSIAGPLMVIGALGAIVWRKGNNIRFLFVALFLIFSSALSVVTVKQIPVWKNSISLWEYVIEMESDAALARNNLGAAYEKAERIKDAIREYQTAIRRNPDYASPYNNLGAAYDLQGRTADALQAYRAALLINPRYAEVHFNMGKLYAEQRRIDNAMKEYLTAIEIDPDYVEAHNNLGITYASAGRIEEAIKEFQTAIKLNPGSVNVHNNLGLLYARQGRTEDAVKEFLLEIQINPDFYGAHYNLGVAYKTLDRFDEAAREFRTVLQLNPNHTGAKKNLENMMGEKK